MERRSVAASAAAVGPWAGPGLAPIATNHPAQAMRIETQPLNGQRRHETKSRCVGKCAEKCLRIRGLESPDASDLDIAKRIVLVAPKCENQMPQDDVVTGTLLSPRVILGVDRDGMASALRSLQGTMGHDHANTMSNSIHDQQVENTTEHLEGSAAIERIQKMIKKAPNCFFCTGTGRDPMGGSRPMNVRKVDEAGNLWFLSSSDSHKNLELSLNSEVTLYFQGSTHSDFMQLSGTAAVDRNAAMIEELWEPILKTWFTEGKEDPRITVIKFTPISGYYWDTKHGNIIAWAKMMMGAALGTTLDDSIEGRLNPSAGSGRQSAVRGGRSAVEGQQSVGEHNA